MMMSKDRKNKFQGPQFCHVYLIYIARLKLSMFFRLQEIIENINDTLEELKYHTAEIQSELDEEENPPDHWCHYLSTFSI